MFPLTKTIEEADYGILQAELQIVDTHFRREREQHPARRFEYAMALRAIAEWRERTHRDDPVSYDIGGAGSPFRHMHHCDVVDPDAEALHEKYTLEQFVDGGTDLAHVVTCLSVLEHIEDLDRFLYHLGCLVAPGGLLFLTMDCKEGDAHVPHVDNCHFHWMRKRIFTPYLVQNLVWSHSLLNLGFTLFGEADWAYHGPTVYDYTFMSLALIKRS